MEDEILLLQDYGRLFSSKLFSRHQLDALGDAIMREIMIFNQLKFLKEYRSTRSHCLFTLIKIFCLLQAEMGMNAVNTQHSNHHGKTKCLST